MPPPTHKQLLHLLLPWLLFAAGCATSDAKIAKMLLAQDDTDKMHEAVVIIGEERRTRFAALLPKLLAGDPRTIIRCSAAQAIGKLHMKSAVPALIEAMGDPQSLVRWDAAIALGEIGDTRAVERLSRTVRFDPDSDVRAAAATSLGKLGTAEAIEALIETLRDRHTSVRHAAARALCKATKCDFCMNYDDWREYRDEFKGQYQ